MRVFQDIHEAESEIRRDISKGPLITSTRVQQQTGIEIQGRERLGYQYSILDIPEPIDEIINFGVDHFVSYRNYSDEIGAWLAEEIYRRLFEEDFYGTAPLPRDPDCSETLHPLLKSTLEGNFPSYTYQARLSGAIPHLVRALKKNPDTRRTFWPIYQAQDAYRFGEPTRIPCSLGYQPMIRDLGNGEKRLVMFYLERSCDFDHFWLTDIYLASLFQKVIATKLDIDPGALIHYVISFHSFDVETEEIY